jgi:hypothetical protein
MELASICKKLLFKATDKHHHDLIKSTKNPTDFCWVEVVELYSTTVIACVEDNRSDSLKIASLIRDMNAWLVESTQLPSETEPVQESND